MKEELKSSGKEFAIAIIGGIILTILINKFLIFSIYVPSGSMLPTIEVGDRMVVRRIYNYDNIKRGDILVFNFKEDVEDTLYIKRVIGLQNDRIKFENNKLYINNEEIKEDYVKYPEEFYGEYTVPEGEYFFLGDNRANSKDSRVWKNPYIKQSEIKGKAFFRFYPFDRIKILK